MPPHAALLFVARIALLTATLSPLMAMSEDGVAQADAASVVDVKSLMSQAARGDARASFLLGAAYASGQTVARNDKEAVYWFRNAAKKGLAEAQYNLAIMYATGTAGVKYNPATAAEWYQQAADQGLAEAQYNLGTMYGLGRGVARNDKLAADWLRKAADQGLIEAVFNLGVLYEHGQGVTRDSEKATAWYTQAAKAGYSPAVQRLRKLRGNDEKSDSAQFATSTVAKSTLSKTKNAPLLSGQRQAEVVQAPAAANPVTARTSDELRSTEWFANLDPDRYTLQILSLTKEVSSRLFIKNNHLEDEAAYFAVRKNDQTWYAVTYGLYDSLEAAESASKSLPESIKELKPWIRRTGRIQQSMLR
ncbi:MAG: SPOR domain-containing protein [Pseudomonadales bacterium]